jgi:hypothetical protein
MGTNFKECELPRARIRSHDVAFSIGLKAEVIALLATEEDMLVFPENSVLGLVIFIVHSTMNIDNTMIGMNVQAGLSDQNHFVVLSGDSTKVFVSAERLKIIRRSAGVV